MGQKRHKLSVIMDVRMDGDRKWGEKIDALHWEREREREREVMLKDTAHDNTEI